MSFIFAIAIGLILIIAGFIVMGRQLKRKPVGLTAVTLGAVACLAAIYPTYIGASIMESKYRMEAQYLIDNSKNNPENAKQAVDFAKTALTYAQKTDNRTAITVTQNLVKKAQLIAS